MTNVYQQPIATHPGWSLPGVKPEGPFKVRDCAINEGLVGCFPLQNRSINLVSGEMGTAGGAASYARGYGVFDGGTTSYYSYSETRLLDLPSSGDFTIMIKVRASSYQTSPGFVCWGGTDDFLIYPFDDSGVQGFRMFWRDVGGSHSGSLSSTPATNTWGTISFVSRGDADHQAYVDEVSTVTFTDSRGSAGPYDSFRIGNWADGTSQAFTGDCEYVYIWQRALSDGERRRVYHAPYQEVLEPVVRNTYFVPVAAAVDVPIYKTVGSGGVVGAGNSFITGSGGAVG